MLNVVTPLTPGWWLLRLSRKLTVEREEVKELDALFRGDHPLPEGPSTLRNAFKRFQRLCRTNYLSLTVEAPLERMRVTGFRDGMDEGDDEIAWDLWQASHLDADQTLIHRTALSLRRAYAIVGKNPRTGETVITGEHPMFVTVETDPLDRREIVAALKMWTDTLDGYMRAVLYTPEWVYEFRSPNTIPDGGHSWDNFTTEVISEWVSVRTTANPYGVVPVVMFENRPGLLGQARSEFEDVIDIQNRINATLYHRLVAEAFGSFRQKAILNYTFDEDDEGNPIVPKLPNNAGEAWFLEGEKLQLFEFSQTQTAAIIEAVTTDIRDLAAITRTPPHYLLGGIVNSSGDALKAAETGLVAKVRERMSQFGESWEQVIRLARLVDGNSTAEGTIETIWADPESRTLGELADSAMKKKAVGVTWRQLMEDLGYTPKQIRRMEAERVQEQLMASLMAPPQAPGAPQTAQNPPGEVEAPE